MMLRYRAAVAVGAIMCAAMPSALGAQAVPAARQQAIEASIRALHNRLRQAAGKLDAVALYEPVLDTDTPPIIESGQLRPTRAAALANTAAGLEALSALSYEYTREHIDVLSPTVAIWVGEGTSRMTLQDGREIVAPFAETLVLVLRDGDWKILHAHRSTPNPR